MLAGVDTANQFSAMRPSSQLLYSPSRERPHWLGYSALLALFPVFHYGLSVFIWLFWFGGMLRNPWQRSRFSEELLYQFTYCAHAFVLFALSLAAYWAGLRNRSAAWRLLLIILSSTVAFFWIDTHFARYQLSVDIATGDYWKNGGRAHHYLTWWWYNDLWFK